MKIEEVPVYRPSGGKSASKMDIVYYHNGEPLVLVESKKRHRTHEKALEEAKNYLRNFPKDVQEFAASGRAPEYIATTVGGEVKFYKHWFEIEGGQLVQRTDELREPLRFDELLAKYGLGVRRKTVIDSYAFKVIFYQIVLAFDIEETREVTPEIVLKAVRLLNEFLKDRSTYTSRTPYTDIDDRRDRQRMIRSVLNQYDWSALNPNIAMRFRKEILRAFQGSKSLNQYITPWTVVEFMAELAELKEKDKVLDFECGSGGFLAAALTKEVPIANLKGIDVADLPYYVSKLFLALYANIQGSDIETKIPLLHDNGLFFHGDDWDVVMSNPAGGSQYDREDELRDIDEVYGNLERDLDGDGKDDSTFEYNFSVQQAVRSAKIGGRICLVLPEGFFSNSTAGFLRKYMTKHCRVKAIISLPSGVFRVGSTTRYVDSGVRSSSQKMSILFAEKIREVVDGEGLDIAAGKLKYPVFLAAIRKPEDARTRRGWLKGALQQVLDAYKQWKGGTS